jgi:hypothetical protein
MLDEKTQSFGMPLLQLPPCIPKRTTTSMRASMLCYYLPPCSPQDAAAQARHVGRADGLQQEILGAFLQAPAECMRKHVEKQKICSITMNEEVCVYEVRTNLLILVGTFSEDMITTGISFSLDDSCMHESHSVGISSIILLASCYQARVKGKEREKKMVRVP